MLTMKTALLTILMAVSLTWSLAQNIGINTDGSLPGMMLDVKPTGASDGIRINNANAGNGDAIINLRNNGADVWTFGFDDSDGDNYKVSFGAALGTNDRFVIDETDNQIRSGYNGTEALPAWAFTSDENTGMFLKSADVLSLTAGNQEFITMSGVGNFTVVNEDGDDADFRIESNLQANIFFVDGGTDRVGIRTNAPGNMLHMTNNGVAVGATAMAYFENTGASGVALSGINTSNANGYNAIEGITSYLNTTGTPAGVLGLAIAQNAATNAQTIGTYGHSNEWQGIGVYGARFNSGGANTGFGGLFVNDLGYTGGAFNVSDERLKENIREMENSLDIILKLRPVTYNLKHNEYSFLSSATRMEYGFIAQEVQKVLPEIVKEKVLSYQDGAMDANKQNETKKMEVLMLDYSRVIPILTKAMQEQQAQIDALKKEIELLKSK